MCIPGRVMRKVLRTLHDPEGWDLERTGVRILIAGLTTLNCSCVLDTMAESKQRLSKRPRLSHDMFVDVVLTIGCSISKLLRASLAKILDVSGGHMTNIMKEELHKPGKIFTPHGTLIDKFELQRKSGGATTIEYISPFALLHYATHLSPQFGEFLAAEIPRSGGTRRYMRTKFLRQIG